MRRLAAFFVILLGVSACGSTAGTVALAVTANATSLFYTDKTLLDFGADAASGRDCSLLHIEEEEPYCQEWAEPNGSVVTLYCYPTLGQPECYKHSLPSGQGRVSFAVPIPEI
jgi:hypothetical protein